MGCINSHAVAEVHVTATPVEEHTCIDSDASVTDGELVDQRRIAAILSLSVALSLMATQPGKTEGDLCRAILAARSDISSADVMSFWRLRRGQHQGSREESLICLASNAPGAADKMAVEELTIPLNVWAAPCISVRECDHADAPPITLKLSNDEVLRSELELRHGGRRVAGALYVPMNAPDHETGVCVQLGVIELLVLKPDGSEADEPTSAERGDAFFPPITRRQVGRLGLYLATALQAMSFLDEKQQEERLLYRMLPRHIVTALQKRRPEDFIVESSERAFVLFSDIVGFTSYCAKRSPRDVVVMLNSMFATFDGLLAKHSVHKVTTIGDAYVAATGLNFMASPTPHLDIVAFALDMLAAVQAFVTEDGERMQIRVGIHVGPVAAGVVGIAMPRYCLFVRRAGYTPPALHPTQRTPPSARHPRTTPHPAHTATRPPAAQHACCQTAHSPAVAYSSASPSAAEGHPRLFSDSPSGCRARLSRSLSSLRRIRRRAACSSPGLCTRRCRERRRSAPRRVESRSDYSSRR